MTPWCDDNKHDRCRRPEVCDCSCHDGEDDD